MSASRGRSSSAQPPPQQRRPSPATPTTGSALSAEESDLSHGQQWWLPQPHASLDEEHSEWRPAVPLAEALQCCLCQDLLKEAITAVECTHSYCYDCIDARIKVGGRSNLCPVCSVLLGPNPWEHNKLKYDFMLDSLVRKVFPRPKLDEALEARRLEREEATRQAKASLRSRASVRSVVRADSSAQLAGGTAAAGLGGMHQGAIRGAEVPSGPVVQLAMFPLPASSSGSGAAASSRPQRAPPGIPTLPKPYLCVPDRTTLGALKTWLTDRVAGKKGDPARTPPLQLHCGGQVLPPSRDAMTVRELHDAVWRPHAREVAARQQPCDQLMHVYYGPACSSPA